MKKSIRTTVAAVAFAAPVLAGAAYTANASVGGDGGSWNHTVDQWTIEEGGSGVYTLDRESVDGVVTLIVTGPDGTIIAPADFPDFVAEAAAEFGADDWEPGDPPSNGE